MAESKTTKLALGGAQFGMPYGVANSIGQPSYLVVDEILRKASVAGISVIDTAQAYGDSEALLGRAIGKHANLRLVTKTRPIQTDLLEKTDIEAVAEGFRESLERLRRGRVYGLLVHDANNLLSRNGELLWDWMQSAKAAFKMDKIGVSVYSPEQLHKVLTRYPGIQLVQLPFNIYDQRFARSGLLDRLKTLDIEIHARSPFLQGLLLISPEHLPTQFAAIKRRQVELHERLHRQGFSPLAGALALCVNDPRIDFVVVGCESVQQLDEIIAAAESHRPQDLEQFAIVDEVIINPSLWAPGK
jgi:aryl-alcohol dehydrogenase-like predicted oxidoreductase